MENGPLEVKLANLKLSMPLGNYELYKFKKHLLKNSTLYIIIKVPKKIKRNRKLLRKFFVKNN